MCVFLPRFCALMMKHFQSVMALNRQLSIRNLERGSCKGIAYKGGKEFRGSVEVH